ncbi:MAG: G8 domain-containing protein, partial [Bacteroidota bacterium]
MQHTHSHNPHPGDPIRHREHMALLDLVPVDQASHVAVNSGDWSDPNTWADGKVPTNGAAVVIAKDVDVTYDVVSDTRLDTLRVDGELSFATQQDTKMVVDTFVVAPTGTLTIGTENNPIADDVKAEILFADNGPIDLRKDPTQIGRGIISHGKVQIHGEEKTVFLKLAKDAMAGDRQLILDEVPTNWEVGDRIVLTGTKNLGERWDAKQGDLVWNGSQDEELTITSINGNRVTIDQPLKYDHDTPRDDLKAYVSNFSRNVVFANENPDVPIQERGHAMFMHSNDVDIRYAAFEELGRTDKSEPLDDFKEARNGRPQLDADGVPVSNDPEDITNRRGRYSLHIHRVGVEPGSDPAFVQGNAVWGSPGLGYVHHDSHAIFDNNAAYDVFGSAFISEQGNETGTWTNNIAIKGEGTGRAPKGGGNFALHDPGKSGVGFWFQGRVVGNEGNVAASQREAGFVYSLRGPLQKDVLADNIEFPQIAGAEDEVGAGKPHIHDFTNNEVIASDSGLKVFKSNPKQDHDVRSVLDGFTAWEIRNEGVGLAYTGKYTLKDLTVIAAEDADKDSIGVNFSNSNVDVTLNNAYIDGFQTGVNQKKSINTVPDNPDKTLDDFRFAFIDVEFANIEGQEITNFDPNTDIRISSRDLQEGRLELQLTSEADVKVGGGDDNDVYIYGTKTDSLGSIGFLNNLGKGGAEQGLAF